MDWVSTRAIVAITLCSIAFLYADTNRSAFGQGARGAYKDVRGLPPAPAGPVVEELLKIVNANDPSAARKFIEERYSQEFREHMPMEEHLAVMREIHDQSQGFELHGYRTYEAESRPNETVVVVRNRLTDAWEAFVMRLESDPPHRIMGLELNPARPPSDLPPLPPLSDDQLVPELEKFLERVTRADAFSGAVLLARDGNVLFKKAYGQACKRYDVPNRIDTKFNLGSMNKMFTGVAVAQLVQQGKLSLEDPLSKYLSSDWLPREVTDKIQIRHLLTHTSGLGSYFNEKYQRSSRALFRNIDDYKPLVADETPRFEPGTQWGYSNTGFLLLGAVIEKVTGQSYFEYVRENISKPAGMINTDCYDMDEDVPNLAMGYTRADGGRAGQRNNLYMHVIRGASAGGGFSTVEDLLRFDQALRSNKLLNPEYTQLVTTAKPEIGSPQYGFGFGVGGSPDNRIVGHSGGFPGISAVLDMHLDTGYTVAVLSNYDGGATIINQKLIELLRRVKR